MIAMVFLCQTFFGWAQYLSIAYVQFGCDQVELGISGESSILSLYRQQFTDIG
jgi:hypothetical protein